MDGSPQDRDALPPAESATARTRAAVEAARELRRSAKVLVQRARVLCGPGSAPQPRDPRP